MAAAARPVAFRRVAAPFAGALLLGIAAVLGPRAIGAAAPAAAQDSLPASRTSPRVTPIVEVVRAVGPTVVNLYADLEIQGGLFGPQEGGSLGSGVIVHPAGLVVTNAHVITGNSRTARPTKVTVSYRADWTGNRVEMEQHPARIIGFDRTNDLALLQIVSPGPFPYAKLGTSADLMIGETVVAVGNPLGREGSVTHGIISATHRRLESPTGEAFDDLIQTDAPLNSGNSGGPLFNILGELVGINQAIAGDRQFGRAEGQGLAIPVDRVRDLLGREFNPFDLLHLWLGLEMGDGEGTGVLVRKVERDGPAAAAGLQAGDRIVRVGDYDIADRTAFNLSISTLTRGAPIELAYQRDGKRRTAALQPIDIDAAIRARLGATVAVNSGYLLFVDVDERGAAGSIGIRQNDALVEFAGAPVASVPELFDRLRKVEPGDAAKLLVYRFTRNRPPRQLEGELKL